MIEIDLEPFFENIERKKRFAKNLYESGVLDE